MCAECDRLKDEVRELRRDLGYESDQYQARRLQTAIEALSSTSDNAGALLKVLICRINQPSTKPVIESIRQFGYRISATGIATVREALS